MNVNFQTTRFDEVIVPVSTESPEPRQLNDHIHRIITAAYPRELQRHDHEPRRVERNGIM